MLDKGWIVPSKSHIASPVILVPKAGGSLQPCMDFTCLNKIMQLDNYLITLIDDIDFMIAGCKFFSKLDLVEAFNQIPVCKEHQQYTTFICHLGVFEYKFMPFRLRNAPATFQRMISEVLGNLIGVC